MARSIASGPEANSLPRQVMRTPSGTVAASRVTVNLSTSAPMWSSFGGSTGSAASYRKGSRRPLRAPPEGGCAGEAGARTELGSVRRDRPHGLVASGFAPPSLPAAMRRIGHGEQQREQRVALQESARRDEVANDAHHQVQDLGALREHARDAIRDRPVPDHQLQRPHHELLVAESGAPLLGVRAERARRAIARPERWNGHADRQLGAPQSRVDALSGEGIVEAGGVADQHHARVPRGRDPNRERAERRHGPLAAKSLEPRPEEPELP